MASRTRKASTPLPDSRRSQTPTTRIEPVVTPAPPPPVPVATGSKARPPRPVSPARTQRIQERTELQALNDRLAVYIERVRNLETENTELRTLVEKQENNREIIQLRNDYDKELGDARNSLDNLARVKAELEIRLSREQESNKDLQDRVKKYNSDVNSLSKNVQQLETTVNDLKAKLAQALTERKNAEAELKEVNDENQNLKKRLEAARVQIEEETIMRVDMENRHQTMKEELNFRKNLYIKDVESAKREKIETREVLVQGLRDQYEEQLANELQALRHENDELLRQGRQELKQQYESKIEALRNEVARKAATIKEIEKTSSGSKTVQMQLGQELDDAKNRITLLEGKVADLKKLLQQEREESRIVLQARERELDEMRAKYELLDEELKDMLDENIKLKREFAVYNNLLSAEESRLHITPGARSPGDRSTSSPSSGSRLSMLTPGFLQRGNKRKRIHIEEEENLIDIVVESNASTDLEISDQDLEGKFVKLTNKGEKEIGLAGYRLVREASANAPQTSFKFSRNNIVKAGASITIWSSNAEGALHNPPTDIIMKSQAWFASDSVVTRLYDTNNEEIAVRKSRKEITSSSSNRMLARLDEADNANRDNCLLM